MRVVLREVLTRCELRKAEPACPSAPAAATSPSRRRTAPRWSSPTAASRLASRSFSADNTFRNHSVYTPVHGGTSRRWRANVAELERRPARRTEPAHGRRASRRCAKASTQDERSNEVRPDRSRSSTGGCERAHRQARSVRRCSAAGGAVRRDRRSSACVELAFFEAQLSRRTWRASAGAPSPSLAIVPEPEITSPSSRTRIGTSLVPLRRLTSRAVGAAAAPGPGHQPVAADGLQLVLVAGRVERLARLARRDGRSPAHASSVRRCRGSPLRPYLSASSRSKISGTWVR